MRNVWFKIPVLLTFLVLGGLAESLAEISAYFYSNSLFYHILFLSLSILIPVLFRISTPYSNFRHPVYRPAARILTATAPGLIPFLFFTRPYTDYMTGISAAYSLVFSIMALLIILQPDNPDAENNPDYTKPDKRVVFPGIFAGYFLFRLISIESSSYFIWAWLVYINLFLLLQYGINLKKTGPYVLSFLSIGLASFSVFVPPVITVFNVQENFEDLVIFHRETEKHELTITQWDKHYWIYIDNLKNLSSFDEALYYEPFIHPAISLTAEAEQVLILGGENGCAAREILKYPSVKGIDIVGHDSVLLNVAHSNPVFISINLGSINNPIVKVIEETIPEFITGNQKKYQLIIIDLPDPRDLESNQYYTTEFYRYCRTMLSNHGILVTQAGSPYFSPRAFQTVNKTLINSGYKTLMMHNQVPTLGEWGWIIASPDSLRKLEPSEIKIVRMDTKWLNPDAIPMLFSFGKGLPNLEDIRINSLDDPVLYIEFLEAENKIK